MIKFGTSGFRGIIGDNWTKENIQKIGFAFRKVVESEGKPMHIVIGYDTRFMGRESAMWFCEAACNDQIKATFMASVSETQRFRQKSVVDVYVPTPYIAYKAVTTDFGVMITASHNPSIYNGIKIFLRGGKEGDDEFFAEIAKNLETKYPLTNFDKLVQNGIVTFSEDTEDYVNQIASSLDIKTIKSGNTKVLLNPMHGSGSAITQKLFDKIGVKFDLVNGTPDPMFGGKMPAPYAHNLCDFASQVVKGKYHFGVALDGDADRVAIIDGDGKFYDCNYLAAAFYYYLTQIKKQSGGAVKNFLTSNLINKLCDKYGFTTHETPVGFKFLGKAMQQSDALLAAESGGMGFKSVSLSKDGIATAAFLVDLVATMKKGIGAIVDELATLVAFPSIYTEFAYPFNPTDRDFYLSNLVSKDKPKFTTEIEKVDTYQDGFKITFKGEYWVGARISGTENAMRIYTEMPTTAACNEVIATMEKFYRISERQK